VPPAAGGKGSGEDPPALGDFFNFLITHLLKAFKISLNVLNRINKVKIL